MNVLKKLLPDVAAIVLFVAISFAYFYPAVFEGRILAQHDAVAGIGAGREHQEYHQTHGKVTRWTNSLFSGMPTYQLAPGYDSSRTLNTVQDLYHLYLPTYVWYVFVMLLGFYILLRAFNFKVWMAALGAILWAFSSYFFIIIAAGHIWKFVTLAYIPPTIAGMVLAYRGKYWTGGIVTALFAALQIVSNHFQMTYYFLFVMLFMAIAFGVKAWKEKTFPQFWKATGVLAIAGVLAVCINLSNLYHTYQYSKESMRGKSELVKPQSADQTGSGLERSYITQWSYGIGETFSLLVPNVKGGASVPLAQNERAMSKANPILGRTTGHFGSGLCGCLCDVPLCLGLFHRERTDEMGVVGRNGILYPAFVGKELYGADRFLHRLCADVQQVPCRFVYPRHSRVHHTFAGDAGVETTCGASRIVARESESILHQLGADGRLVALVCLGAPGVLSFVCIDNGNERPAERASRRTFGTYPDESGGNACQHLYRRCLA